jgi:hypothetical protein
MALIDRIKGILLEPKFAWTAIAAEPATTQSIYTGWVMILAAIGPLATLVGFADLGVAWSVRLAVGSYVIALVITFVLAMIVDVLAPSFGGQRDFVARSSSRTASRPRGSPARRTAGDVRRTHRAAGVDLRVVHVLLGAPCCAKCSADKAVPSR